VRHVLTFGLALALVGTMIVSVTRAADKKYSIKDVMKAHKKGELREKVLAGTATADEKQTLVDMYKAMEEAKPPKGDDANWKKLTKAMVKAAEDVRDNKEGAIKDPKCMTYSRWKGVWRNITLNLIQRSSACFGSKFSHVTRMGEE